VVGIEVSGSAADFTTVSGGNVVMIAGENDVGLHSLTISAVYTSWYSWESSSSANQKVSKTIDVVVTRGSDVESWPLYAAWGLAWANLVFAVASMYLYCDPARKATVKKVVTPPRENSLQAAHEEIDLVLMD